MRLIDADALRDEFVWLMNNVNSYNRQAVYETIERLDIQPTIDAEPVRHGHWTPSILLINRQAVLANRCSCCQLSERFARQTKLSYCPHCGAKMDEVTE